MFGPYLLSATLRWTLWLVDSKDAFGTTNFCLTTAAFQTRPHLAIAFKLVSETMALRGQCGTQLFTVLQIWQFPWHDVPLCSTWHPVASNGQRSWNIIKIKILFLPVLCVSWGQLLLVPMEVSCSPFGVGRIRKRVLNAWNSSGLVLEQQILNMNNSWKRRRPLYPCPAPGAGMEQEDTHVGDVHISCSFNDRN